MKLNWTILGLGAACAACCAPLLIPLLAGAGLGGALGGRALKLDWEAIACAGLAATALAALAFLAARRVGRRKATCDCPQRCDLPAP